LAVDLGLRAGLAYFGADTRLCWYRSTHFGSIANMKKGAWTLVRDLEDIGAIVVEGDRRMADIWRRIADKRGLEFTWIQAEHWRPALLLRREQRSGAVAKDAADTLAREIIEASGAPRPTSLRHDAAEAICIGHWALTDTGRTSSRS